MTDAKPKRDVWVRARDGALYKNPHFFLDGGFIRFDPDSGAELVLWLPRTPEGEPWPVELEVPKELNPAQAVRAIFGSFPTESGAFGADLRSIELQGVRLVTLPGANPPSQDVAAVYSFKVTGRIPRPQLHGGFARYASRLPEPRCEGGPVVIEARATAEDVSRTEIQRNG